MNKKLIALAGLIFVAAALDATRYTDPGGFNGYSTTVGGIYSSNQPKWVNSADLGTINSEIAQVVTDSEMKVFKKEAKRFVKSLDKEFNKKKKKSFPKLYARIKKLEAFANDLKKKDLVMFWHRSELFLHYLFTKLCLKGLKPNSQFVNFVKESMKNWYKAHEKYIKMISTQTNNPKLEAQLNTLVHIHNNGAKATARYGVSIKPILEVYSSGKILYKAVNKKKGKVSVAGWPSDPVEPVGHHL
ncbi:hypothetical protein HN446_02880 [bacterium]|jgi:hypothetical protein|nr:hypothetical protein [bacterium]